ncbi:hypothetical protein EmuJ_000164400 [Echinococcus multilocularis]|uniref:Uncharacterized protein n=1 Tax=Echinococcus multilocularis TaxID=6211 RepID=A0A087W076_ECHMU|nr:hypothetical protein EmuJ_000164400 [Echinococcus multilocularis]
MADLATYASQTPSLLYYTLFLGTDNKDDVTIGQSGWARMSGKAEVVSVFIEVEISSAIETIEIITKEGT